MNEADQHADQHHGQDQTGDHCLKKGDSAQKRFQRFRQRKKTRCFLHSDGADDSGEGVSGKSRRPGKTQIKKQPQHSQCIKNEGKQQKETDQVGSGAAGTGEIGGQTETGRRGADTKKGFPEIFRFPFFCAAKNEEEE